MNIRDGFNYLRNLRLTHSDNIQSQQEDSFGEWIEYINGRPLTSTTANKILAQYTNAHVAICTSVLSDAIAQLPADIIRITTSNGSRTEIDDNAHPANQLFRGPNPEMTYADFMQGIVSSLLLAGNAYVTIDPVGRGKFPELYLRDPGTVTPNLSQDYKQIINYTIRVGTTEYTYPRDRVIHIREFNVSNPLIGRSKLDALALELQMDEYVKLFNANFFKNGAVMGQVWTPEHRLTPAQHKEIGNAMAKATQGVGNAWKIFINKYPGKLETPDQKHKDIAFLDLLKYIRETINGVFKVPPYKAGVLEYANYANSVQQQESFWTDGVKPLIRRIQDALNKDFIWKYFDPTHEIRLDLSGVAALKGNPKEQMEIFTGYQKQGILTIDEVRAELGKEPLNSTPQAQQSTTQNAYTQLYFDFFEAQVKRIHSKIDKITVDGIFQTPMEYTTSDELFDLVEENKLFHDFISPTLRDTIMTVGEINFKAANTDEVFDMSTPSMEMHLRSLNLKHDTINAKSFNIVDQLLTEYKTRKWDVSELKARITDKLCYDYAKECAKEVVPSIVRRTESLVQDQKLLDSITEKTDNVNTVE